MTTGERIKQRRIELGWSQRDLAAEMGYTNNSTITRIENGKVDIPQSRIVQFSQVLGVSVGHLMGWDEEMNTAPVEMAERHIEIIMDEDISEIFEEFRSLSPSQKRIVKNLIHDLAQTKKEV